LEDLNRFEPVLSGLFSGFYHKKKRQKASFNMTCDPDWIRTNDPQLRRLMLYPAELPGPLNGGKSREKKLNFQAFIIPP
jgi:hypothetical protein